MALNDDNCLCHWYASKNTTTFAEAFEICKMHTGSIAFPDSESYLDYIFETLEYPEWVLLLIFLLIIQILGCIWNSILYWKWLKKKNLVEESAHITHRVFAVIVNSGIHWCLYPEMTALISSHSMLNLSSYFFPIYFMQCQVGCRSSSFSSSKATQSRWT